MSRKSSSDEGNEKKEQGRYMWLSVVDNKLMVLGYGLLELPTHIDPASPAIEVCTKSGCFRMARTQFPKDIVFTSDVSSAYISPRKDLLIGYTGAGIPRVIAVRHADRWLIADYPLELSPREFRGAYVRIAFPDASSAEHFLAWLHSKSAEDEEAGNAPITSTFSETPVVVSSD